MRIRFRASIQGMKFNEEIEGKDADEVVVNLRNAVAGKVPHIPFTKKDDKIREQLDVDGKGDWTDAEFREFVVGYWNEKLRPWARPKVLVPADNQTFIDLVVTLGMATVVQP